MSRVNEQNMDGYVFFKTFQQRQW